MTAAAYSEPGVELVWREPRRERNVVEAVRRLEYKVTAGPDDPPHFPEDRERIVQVLKYIPREHKIKGLGL